MDKYLDLLTESGFAFGKVGLALTGALVLALWLLLPRSERRKARLPTLLFLLLVLARATHKLPASRDTRDALEVAGVFLVLACLGRGSFVLVVDWFFVHRLRRPVSRIFADIVQVVVWVGVVLGTFREMGAELGSLLTTSALLTAVIGLSLQETLGNLFAGLAIQAQRPFRIGDWIQIEGAPDASIGKVMEINWRATKILTLDGVEIVVPNALLAKSPLRNYTHDESTSRRGVRLHVPYEVAPHQMEEALLEAIKGCPEVSLEPPPSVAMNQFGDNGIEYSLFFTVNDFGRRAAADSAVRRRIWYALQRAGISTSVPVRDVRIAQTSEADAQRTEADRLSERQGWLHAVDFFSVLPKPALESLARDSKTRLYGPGEDVIRQGEEGTELFIIQSGEALVLVNQQDREPVEIARLGRGGICGEMSLFTGEPRNATVRTVSPCQMMVVNHRALRQVLEQNPELLSRISDVLANRQAEIEKAQSVTETHDRTTDSGVLLDRIRNFFSLWPLGGPHDDPH